MALWGKTDTENDKPKYLTAAEKAITTGLTAQEATDPSNKARGKNTAGWVTHTQYVDSTGSVRNKAETLVAIPRMSN